MVTSPLYAVIDLGSNSFHMLITRLVAQSVQVVDKVKRKVRLASGLNEHNQLDDAAFARGVECLSFFAERLQDIPTDNIRIVATATLRIASNADQFLEQAEQVLGKKISLLTGEQEAVQIYLGVAHTSCSVDDRLVLDIGGASTEIIIGNGFKAIKVTSLNMGCVTFNNEFFPDQQLSKNSFTLAVQTAKKLLTPLATDYQTIGWQTALGGSGTMQALTEILNAQHLPAIITLDFLQQIKNQLLNFKHFNVIRIKGLSSDRIPVFASGLTILTAIFETFSIESLQLSSGALREGLLYEMLPDMKELSIRHRTIKSLCQRFHIDEEHADRVTTETNTLYNQFSVDTPLLKEKIRENEFKLLTTACTLHEIGLLLEYKQHQKHGAYIINNADLPGFNQEETQFLALLIQMYKGSIDISLLNNQTAVGKQNAKYLLATLRLAVILCHRRQDEVLPFYQAKLVSDTIYLSLPRSWLITHPLIFDELKQEHQHLQVLGLSLSVVET